MLVPPSLEDFAFLNGVHSYRKEFAITSSESKCISIHHNTV